MGKVTKKELEFYSHQGVRTEVPEGTFDDFPDSVEEIVKIIQGLLIHPGSIDLYGIKMSKSRIKDRNLKTVQEVITKAKKLDKSSLIIARKPEDRVVGICKHFSMVLVSILRSKGIPARARCGFALYFKKGWFEDHWICEYWDREQKRWVRVDAQIDDILAVHLGINKNEINPLDLIKGEFFYGADIWKLYREDLIDGKISGFSLSPGLKGEWYIRGNMMRDFFSLNEIEYLYSEEDDLMSGYYNPNKKDLKFLDKIAKLTSKADKNFKKIRELYSRRKDLRPKGI